MKFVDTAIDAVKIIEPTVFGDERGFFMETFRANEFASHCAPRDFVQENHSLSTRGILRGLHYQIQQPQGKLVRVTRGRVYDVAVDLRRSSATFGKWVGVELSADNKRQLWVPEGFAHGFYVMSETAEFVYKCTDYYAPDYERSLRWDDPSLGIEWPLLHGETPRLSAKDEAGATWHNAEFFD
jgi:dTDP-4-dehydrorhamnose 3,5-epimerase